MRARCHHKEEEGVLMPPKRESLQVVKVNVYYIIPLNHHEMAVTFCPKNSTRRFHKNIERVERKIRRMRKDASYAVSVEINRCLAKTNQPLSQCVHCPYFHSIILRHDRSDVTWWNITHVRCVYPTRAENVVGAVSGTVLKKALRANKGNAEITSVG